MSRLSWSTYVPSPDPLGNARSSSSHEDVIGWALKYKEHACEPLVLTQAMGFSTAKAAAALEECEGDPAAAIEWLVANCT